MSDLAPSDYGPSIQRRNGHLEIVDAADPGSPHRTIRRARRVCRYDEAHRRGSITDAEREAADRYAVTCEREAGARDGRDGPGVASAPWSRQPALTALQATASLRAAHAVVGHDGAALLRLYVRDNVSAEEIGRRRGEGKDLCMGRIKGALTRLVEHWNI